MTTDKGRDEMKHHEKCDICINSKPFEMPEEIVNATMEGKLVVFAGAGVSTERKHVFPYTLYEDIAYELGTNPESISLSFSQLMSKYCQQKNGRKKLLNKIRNRIDYVKTFLQLYNFATQFHEELSTIYLIKDIVTTSWDDFFEKECGAIPIVTKEDFAFWDLPERKVLKIHGSINNIGSIIVTAEDYRKCLRRLRGNIIGSYLKLLLATKTVVFIGYSFGDEDFNRIYVLLKKELGQITPHSYVVTLDTRFQTEPRDSSMTPIITDGTFFIHCLKRILMEKGVLIVDVVSENVTLALQNVLEIHCEVMKNFNVQLNPILIYTYSYQDGLIDAFQRYLAKKCTGEYSNPVNIHDQLRRYEQIRKEKIHRKKYFDVAYIDGYINGLILFLNGEKAVDGLPMFYVYGYKNEIRDQKSFKDLINSKQSFHKGASKYAEGVIKAKNLDDPEIFLQHTPFLL